MTLFGLESKQRKSRAELNLQRLRVCEMPLFLVYAERFYAKCGCACRRGLLFNALTY